MLYQRAEVQGDSSSEMPPLPLEPQVSEFATINSSPGGVRVRTLETCVQRMVIRRARVRATPRSCGVELGTGLRRAGPDTPTDPNDLKSLREQLIVLATERTRIELVIAAEIQRVQLVETGPITLFSKAPDIPGY
jgi:hypothetical protein